MDNKHRASFSKRLGVRCGTYESRVTPKAKSL